MEFAPLRSTRTLLPRRNSPDFACSGRVEGGDAQREVAFPLEKAGKQLAAFGRALGIWKDLCDDDGNVLMTAKDQEKTVSEQFQASRLCCAQQWHDAEQCGALRPRMAGRMSR